MGFETSGNMSKERKEKAVDLGGELSDIVTRAESTRLLTEAIKFMGTNTRQSLEAAIELAKRQSPNERPE